MNQAPRVLVVDDDPEYIALVSGMLKRSGYEVRSAPTVDTGLQLVNEEEFDVVLLDYRFDNSSITLTRVIGEFVGKANAGVIMLTAFGDTTIQADAKMLGVSVYLTKPVKEEVLLRAIAQLLVKPGGAPRLPGH